MEVIGVLYCPISINKQLKVTDAQPPAGTGRPTLSLGSCSAYLSLQKYAFAVPKFLITFTYQLALGEAPGRFRSTQVEKLRVTPILMR